MASERERDALARFGSEMSAIFRDWGHQRARRAEFDASMAQAELARRDAKDARAEMAEINRRTLELQEERAAEDIRRYDLEQEYLEEERNLADEVLRLTGGALRGYQSPAAVGQVAGQELGRRIGEADGFLPQIRAAVTGFSPALQKGFQEAPTTSYAGNMGEYAKQKGLSDKQLGLLYDAAPQLFEPNYDNLLKAAMAYVEYGVALPDEYAYLGPKLDEKVEEIKEEKDYDKRIGLIEEKIKIVSLDRLKNPQKYTVRTGGDRGAGTSDLKKLLDIREDLELAGFDTSKIDATIEAMGFGKAGETKGEGEGADGEDKEVTETDWNTFINDFTMEHDPTVIGERADGAGATYDLTKKMYNEAMDDMGAAITNGAPENIVQRMQAIVLELKQRFDALESARLPLFK